MENLLVQEKVGNKTHMQLTGLVTEGTDHGTCWCKKRKQNSAQQVPVEVT